MVEYYCAYKDKLIDGEAYKNCTSCESSTYSCKTIDIVSDILNDNTPQDDVDMIHEGLVIDYKKRLREDKLKRILR